MLLPQGPVFLPEPAMKAQVPTFWLGPLPCFCRTMLCVSVSVPDPLPGLSPEAGPEMIEKSKMKAWGQEVAAAAASGWKPGVESPGGGARGERLTGEPLDRWGIPISGRILSKS